MKLPIGSKMLQLISTVFLAPLFGYIMWCFCYFFSHHNLCPHFVPISYCSLVGIDISIITLKMKVKAHVGRFLEIIVAAFYKNIVYSMLLYCASSTMLFSMRCGNGKSSNFSLRVLLIMFFKLSDERPLHMFAYLGSLFTT